MKVKEHQDATAKLNAATEVRTLATWQRTDHLQPCEFEKLNGC